MSEIKKFLDFEGLKFLWSKISMEDYPNNETLATVINAIDQTKANKEDLVASDWNQTDEAALDYIKNKPDLSVYATNDYVNNKVPEVSDPYMQLVTDASGNTKWEERTHYGNETIISWDGNTEGLTRYRVFGVAFFKVSDLTPSFEELLSGNVQGSLYAGVDTREEIDMSFVTNYTGAYAFGKCSSMTPAAFVVTSAPAKVAGITIEEPGIYFALKGFYVEYIKWGEVVTLGEEYIPTTVPRVETASVGQLIAVKSVDENGKPIEWEAFGSEEDALAILMEMEFVEPVAAADGSVFTDSNGALYSL